MSTTTRLEFTTRRRSHSASTGSPSPIPHLMTDDPWRCSTKRAQPHQLSPHRRTDRPQKWDVDAWRKGKRARKDSRDESLSPRRNKRQSMSSPIRKSSPNRYHTPPTFSLPSTSAAFNLYPNRKRTRHSPRSSPPRHVPSSPMLLSDDAELSRLRSDAFGELHRSIEEGGEGFIRRMRDWEQSKPRPGPSSNERAGAEELHNPLKRGRVRTPSYQGPISRSSDNSSLGEDDDVQIIGDASVGLEPKGKKRALSLGDIVMDADHDLAATAAARSTEGHIPRCSSPRSAFTLGPSVYSSDDEDLFGGSSDRGDCKISFASFFTPELSHTLSTSANSSLVSLPLPPPRHTMMMDQTFNVPSSASHSEKAIAALSLALANGAGGLNDYEELRAVTGQSIVEGCEVGQMWD